MTALVAAVSLVVTPLLVAPGAYAATDPAPSSSAVSAETTDEPAVVTDVVAPEAGLLAFEGQLAVGRTVVVDPQPDLWSPAGVDLTFTYQWYAGTEKIAGQTGTGLTLTPETVGKQVSVEITGAASEDAVDGVRSASVVVTGTGTVAPGDFDAPAPTTTGTAQVGKTLTAKTGTWQPAATWKYRWLRDGAAISHATGATYTLTSADLGKRIVVEVTGSAQGYTERTLRSAPTVAVAAASLATATPKISGTVRVGSKVTAKPGTWTTGTSLSYRWYASGRAVSGATKSSYTPTPSLKGRTLTVRVTGTKTGYTTVTRASSGAKVAAGVLSAPRPRIKGTVKVGGTVSVTRGTWKPGASTYRYQWKVGGASIKGATGTRYRIPAKYAGKRLTVSVKGSRSGYTTRTVTSASSKVLRVYPRTSAPKVSGTVRVGSTLKVSSKGAWSPAPSSWKYQWRANGTAIKGATRSSIKLSSAQHGKRITVTVTGARSGYFTASRTSSATAKVAWPVGVSKPKVTGNPKVQWVTSGQTATFTVKASGGKLRYQWQISADGKKWTNLSGKTAATLKLTTRSSRDGSLVRAVVKNAAGSATSKSGRLWVDSTRNDPYRSNFAFSMWNWAEVIGSTHAEAWSSSKSLVYAPTAVCYSGDGSAYPWLDLDVEYVGSNGVVYDDDYEFFDDDIWSTSELYDGGCTSFTAYAIVPSGAVKGGTWRVTDSSELEYDNYIQWVAGR